MLTPSHDRPAGGRNRAAILKWVVLISRAGSLEAVPGAVSILMVHLKRSRPFDGTSDSSTQLARLENCGEAIFVFLHTNIQKKQ